MDIFSKFDSIHSEVVKREKRDRSAALEPFESKLVTHGTTITDLECAANDQDVELSDVQVKVSVLSPQADSL